MKKGTIILGSIIGGAILGSAATICCCRSKRGGEMRKLMHEKILEQLDHLHDHIKGCSCMSGGDCDCECGDKMESIGSMESMEGVVKEKIAQVKEKVGEKIDEVKGKMSDMKM